MRMLIPIFLVPLLTTGAVAEDELMFNRDIRPILSDNCFACHGPDAESRKGKLRLDVRGNAVAERRGANAIVPGDAKASALMARMLTHDESERMPPSEEGKQLEPSEIETIRRWIDQGATYQSHWAFIAPTRPATPEVRVESGLEGAVDRFIHANLQAHGVSPAGVADPVTLVRRLHFDLTGLPPTPEVIDAFAQSPTREAYIGLVDSLLASKHYGERMSSYWLDLVRFADTQGYHSDDKQNIYPYRDYVIAAFNSNMGFDQFTTEQLAGDLLEEANLQQKIASGYNRLNQVTGEGGAQAGEYLTKYTADRVRTTSEVWMGATLGCAECHDHKFDPFTARDFYSFGAFFADLDQVGVYSGNARSTGNYPPMLDVPQPEEVRAWKANEEQLTSLRKERDVVLRRLATALEAPKASDWQLLIPTRASSSGASSMEVLADGSILSTGKRTKRQNYTVVLPLEQIVVGALRLDVLTHESFGGFSRGNGNAVLSSFEAFVLEGTGRRRLNFTAVEANVVHSAAWPAEGTLDDDAQTGWAVFKDDGQPSPARTVVFRLEHPESLRRSESLEIVLYHEAERDFHNLGRFRVGLSRDPATALGGELTDDVLIEAVATPVGVRTEAQTARVRAHIVSHNPPELRVVSEQLARAERERDKLDKLRTNTMVSRAVEPRVIRILPRGDWLDSSGEIVEPGVPHFLPQPNAREEQRLTRLDLAKWILDADNPLTARVFVNRLWYLFFGQGLSNVLNDLGSQGEWPRHPELLDWLAVEFRESGWDMKHMVRLLVTSRTYQLSSTPSAEQLAIDPLNRLHARQARYRLQAEFVRDNALAISGLLLPELGGPSVKPYQPAGYWSDSYKSVGNPHKYVQSMGDDLYRRGMYTYWMRSFLHPSLLAFDAPNRESCEARRPISNTPLQALVLLNDPTYVEAARAFAVRAMLEGGASESERLTWIMRQAVGRSATPAELAVLAQLYAEKRARYEANGADATALQSIGEYAVPDDLDVREVAAWTAVTRTVLNLHETVTRN